MPRTDAAHRERWEAWNEQGGPRYPAEVVIRFCLRSWPEAASRKGLRALDLGCGTGANACFLAQEGFDVVATDLSRSGVEETGRRLARAGLSAELRRESADHIGMEDASVDLVICTGVLESAGPRVAAAAVREAARVLKRGGRGLFLFMAEGDFRSGDATACALHGYDRETAAALFDGCFGKVDLDQATMTFEGGKRRQIDWIVTVVK